MFSKLSRFRSSKSGSRNGSQQDSSQGGSHSSHDDNENSSSPARNNVRISFSQAPTTQSVPATAVPAHLIRKSGSLPLSKSSIPIPSVSPLIENYDSDSDGNVSFAECLFPITPPEEVRLGSRLSHESFMDDVDTDDVDQLVLPPTARSLEPDIAFRLRKQVETGRMSVDLGRRSVDKPVPVPVPGRRSVDVKNVYSWDAESAGFSDSSLGRWESKKDRIDRRRTTWEASYRQVWVPPNGDPGGTTTRGSWTSSPSVREEARDGARDVPSPRDEAEDEFLEEFEDYFNNLQVDNVRRKQFPKLELQKIVYLDYASFSLFSNFQVQEHLKILLAQGPCLGVASFSSCDNPLFKHVSDTQHRLLRMLNTTAIHYSIIFTAGFQESFRVVAESYPFRKGTPVLICQDNHAAVQLVIQAALRVGGKAFLTPVTEKELCFHSHDVHKLLRAHASSSSHGGNGNGSSGGSGGLFVYPAQSNVSGMKHSLSWVVEAQQHHWKVCLDASTLLPSSGLDLDIHQPDFVVGSFHHLVGYPSGMGFLLVRRESFCVQASPSNNTVRFIPNKPADEGEHCHIMCPADNTVNLLQFAALNLGLIQLERIGFVAIQKRVRALAIWLVQRLRTLRHKTSDHPHNGSYNGPYNGPYNSSYSGPHSGPYNVPHSGPYNGPHIGPHSGPHLVRVYGSHAVKDRGSIVAFNVMDPSGTVLPPDIVRKLAGRSNIQVSVGQFRNPGLAYLLGGKPRLRPTDVSVFDVDSQEFTTVRASLGAVSNFADVYKLVQFLVRFRDEEYLASEAIGFVEERNHTLQ